MLILSDTRVIPSLPNVLTLVTEDGSFLYVHCGVYADAAILNDKYKENLEVFRQVLNPGVLELPEIVKTVYDYLPEPVNILSYYLLLIKDLLTDELSMTDAIGALHAISSVINFRKFPTMLTDVRQQVRFTLYLRDEYQLSWDAFFQTAIPFDNLTAVPTVSGGGNTADDEEDEEYDIEKELAELEAFEFPEYTPLEETESVEVEVETEPEPTPANDAAAARRNKLMSL